MTYPWYPQPGGVQPLVFGSPGYVQWLPTQVSQGQWGGAQTYTDAYGGTGPVASQLSDKYPDLNPILAIDTTKLRFDIKRHPQSEILASTWYSFRAAPAKSTPTSFMRLICPKFPWSIDIKLQQPGASVSCGMIWEAIHQALQEPLEDSEWGMIVMDKKLKEKVEAAMQKRMEANPNGPVGLRRIDYLGDCTLFKGLEKDKEFAKARTMPGEATPHETWVLKLTS